MDPEDSTVNNTVQFPGAEANLSPEETADLKEAVEAEQAAANTPQAFQEIITLVNQLHGKIIEMLGRGAAGPLAYSRNKAIEKLEEVVHRVGDGLTYIRMRGPVEDAAIAQAQKDGKIIDLTNRK